MTSEELKHIIKKGESLNIEFKTCGRKLPGSLFESVCAFLNTKGGKIFLGVEDEG